MSLFFTPPLHVDQNVPFMVNNMADSSPQKTKLSAGAIQRNFSFPGKQNSKEARDSSDSEDEDLFDGEKFKSKLLSVWNNVRYGFTAPGKTYFKEDSPIWLLGRCYHSKNHEFSKFHSSESSKILSMVEFQRDFSSLIWLTYRKEFPQLNGSTLTTDCGWGCMLRSGQMMLATGLVYHFLGREWRSTGRCHNKEQRFFYKQILRFFSDLPDELSPFSLHHLVNIGQQSGKQAGDWYGPASVAHILKSAMDTTEHSLLKDVRVYVAQDCTVYKDEVISLCTTCRNCHKNRTDNVWHSVIILVPVRLGGEGTNPIYRPCVKSLFTLDHCIGIIGGRPKHSLYFVGFQDDHMINLDPHYCQPVVDMKDENFSTESFHCLSPRKMSMRRLDPSCTMGFYCDSRESFNTFCSQTTEVLRPPMQRGDYPMFVFADTRSPTVSEGMIRATRLSESLSDDEQTRRRRYSSKDDYVML